MVTTPHPSTPASARRSAALVQVRAYLAHADLPEGDRLPPERRLCALLGISRGDLRKALSVLEAEGQLWRRVGKGTFVGGPPLADGRDLAAIKAATNPSEVMQARLLLEPEIAREAALHASAADVARMHQCLVNSRACEAWRQYESWDNQLHRTIAEASANATLVYLFDTLNAIRRAVVWGRLRAAPSRPPADHHSFAEHALIVAAIEDRDRNAAAQRMREHLRTVRDRLLDAPMAAE